MLAAGLVALIAIVAFSEPRTRTNALYFTVTVSSTVGFGGCHRQRPAAARRVVTGQMIVDLVAVGLAVKVIVDAVRRGRRSKPQNDRYARQEPVTAG
jgi:voltage-gated potassium channel